jgi:hypothetical protein
MTEANDATRANDGDADAVARVTSRVAGLDLDAPTVELIMAALTADVCDHVDGSPS